MDKQEERLAPAVDLYWIPLGAGGYVVRWSGKLYEALKAFVERRPRLDLYHSALQIWLPDDRFVIECAAILNLRGEERGVVAGGPVGMSWLGRFRHFRYEMRRWRGGSIPDLAHAVLGLVRVASDVVRAQRVLDLVPSVPTLVWGRDELRTGEMWNSNSVISWLLACAGIDTDGLEPSSWLERRSGGGRTPDATPNTLKSEAGSTPHLAAAHTAKSPEAFVFLSSQGTHLRRSNFNRRVWKPAARAAGIEGLRVHDLRHTAGTLATAAGGSLREVMDRLDTRPPWPLCATSTLWPTGTRLSPASRTG